MSFLVYKISLFYLKINFEVLSKFLEIFLSHKQGAHFPIILSSNDRVFLAYLLIQLKNSE